MEKWISSSSKDSQNEQNVLMWQLNDINNNEHC